MFGWFGTYFGPCLSGHEGWKGCAKQWGPRLAVDPPCSPTTGPGPNDPGLLVGPSAEPTLPPQASISHHPKTHPAPCTKPTSKAIGQVWSLPRVPLWLLIPYWLKGCIRFATEGGGLGGLRGLRLQTDSSASLLPNCLATCVLHVPAQQQQL